MGAVELRQWAFIGSPSKETVVPGVQTVRRLSLDLRGAARSRAVVGLDLVLDKGHIRDRVAVPGRTAVVGMRRPVLRGCCRQAPEHQPEGGDHGTDERR